MPAARSISRSRQPTSAAAAASAPGSGVVPVRRDEKSEPVKPTLATVKSGEYALSRNLFFYTIGEPAGDVKAFIDWVLGPEGQKLCEKVGYYPINK